MEKTETADARQNTRSVEDTLKAKIRGFVAHPIPPMRLVLVRELVPYSTLLTHGDPTLVSWEIAFSNIPWG